MPLITPADLAGIIPGLKAKYQLDAFRMSLFIVVVLKRAGDIATTDPTHVVPFAKASASLIGDWTSRAADVAKNPWRYLFSDPFRALRDQTRVFATTWNLDASFIAAMGA